MLGAFLLLSILLAIDPPGGFYNWVMGNIPTAVALAALLVSWWRLPLSNGAYALCFVFLALHVVGTHHGYRVPIDAVELSRNQYDRVVHVAFGLLLTIPLREALVRSGKADGWWADFLAVMLILALAAFYEVAEWLGAEAFWPGTAESFLGFQGDSLDATKDLALALAGSIAAAAVHVAWRRIRPARTPLATVEP